ncbi:MAG: sterol desaturase family protein [Microscillaceae bacterium]|nr:sterol desaturase family protein [Microscillaceae bacterium]MDW8460405.1 sterol desaturase family protein [Cytophagales bacterium]
METIIGFFDTISSPMRSIILVGGLVFFWIIEGVIPLFAFQYAKWRHGALNIFFTFTTVIINLGFAFWIVQVSDWAKMNQFGLLYIFALPTWLFMLLGLMVLDLIGAYLIHWLEHKVWFMWQFHIVHHTDNYVDVTTANRHHPGESVLRALFTLLAVLLTGAPMWLVMLYQTLSVAFSQFNHANIKLPERIDKLLSWVIVSPNMHKVHHHYKQPYTDSNYGNIFAIWDRLFGTFRYMPVNEPLVYGLDTHYNKKEQSDLTTLLKSPFQPYREPQGRKN